MFRTSIRRRPTSSVAAQARAMQQALQRTGLVRRARIPPPSVVAANAGFLRNRAARGMRLEKKVIDINSTGYAVENTGTQLQLLNGCVAGSQNFNRIGRKINLKSLQIHGSIYQADTTSQFTKCRLLIVFDKQSNGAAPTFADIITSQNIAGTTSSTVNDMVNLNNRDRFEIIRDLMYTVDGISDVATQSYSGGTTIVPVDLYIKLGNRETVYNAGTAGTVGDIQSGALYMFLIASQPNATGVSANLSFRTRFVDV